MPHAELSVNKAMPIVVLNAEPSVDMAVSVDIAIQLVALTTELLVDMAV